MNASAESILAACGDDAGAAWLISQRSPSMPISQLRYLSRIEGQRDTFGRPETKRYLQDKAHNIAKSVRTVDHAALAEIVDNLAQELSPAFVESMLQGHGIVASAESAGIRPKALYAAMAKIRANYPEFGE